MFPGMSIYDSALAHLYSYATPVIGSITLASRWYWCPDQEPQPREVDP